MYWIPIPKSKANCTHTRSTFKFRKIQINGNKVKAIISERKLPNDITIYNYILLFEVWINL